MDAKRFAEIFDGLKSAYGVYSVDRKKANGKSVGKAMLIREERTTRLWEKHLAGGGDALAIIPINEDNKVKWGCLDVDEYPLDHKLLVEKVRRLKIPMVVCRSKSGGAHCYVFVSEWMPAGEMQEILRHMSSAMGTGNAEIFPKQTQLFLDRGDVGNFLNVPYDDYENGLRYAIKDDGQSATLDEFFDLYEEHVQTPEQLHSWVAAEEDAVAIKDGPPCLQHLCKQKISEGGRNNGLFNIGVYLRKSHPDSWETEIQNYNITYLQPPLPLNEVNAVAKQLQKSDYAYKCKDQPIVNYCNNDLCRTRKFGIDAAVSGATVANLRKYDSDPPVWFVDVNGAPVELDTEGLMNQTNFQRACIDQLNHMPRSLTKQAWESRINTLLSDMQKTEGSVVEVSEDASTSGAFYELLEEWVTAMQKANDREEILLKRPWTDEDEGTVYFRIRDLEAHLKRNQFKEYKPHKIAQRLRDINGAATSISIKNKAVRVWVIPAFENIAVDVETPDFGENNEAPF